jgi:hypothetical protein
VNATTTTTAINTAAATATTTSNNITALHSKSASSSPHTSTTTKISKQQRSLLLKETSPCRMSTVEEWWSSRSTRQTHQHFLRSSGRDVLSFLITHCDHQSHRQVRVMESITRVLHSQYRQCTVCGGKGRGSIIVNDVIAQQYRMEKTEEDR